MTADANTVRQELSGADSVLPLLAGWEKTGNVPSERSSQHEASYRSPKHHLDDSHDRRRRTEAKVAFGLSADSAHLLSAKGVPHE